MTVQLFRKKFTVQQYRQMLASGILTERDRVERLQGEIIEISSIGYKHAAGVDRLTGLLAGGLADRALFFLPLRFWLNEKLAPVVREI